MPTSTLDGSPCSADNSSCGYFCHIWSKKKLLDKVGWLSVSQSIQYHTVLQAHKTIQTRRPTPMFNSIYTDHPKSTSQNIKFGDTFNTKSTFKYFAIDWYNRVPEKISKEAKRGQEEKNFI